MESTSSASSPLLTPVFTAESLPLTKLSGKESEVSETLNSQISRSSPISKLRTWIQLGFLLSQGLQKMIADERGKKGRTGRRMNHVINGMTESAVKQKRIAEDCTSATNAGNEDIKERSVENDLAVIPKCLKYLKHSVWTDADTSPSFSPTACCTLCN